MIDIIFYFGTDIIFVRVNGTNIGFANSSQGNCYAPIDGLKLSKNGVVKEFPDLEYDAEWHDKAIARFKERIKTMKNEESIAKYVVDDLKKFGYAPKFWQAAGFRKIKL